MAVDLPFIGREPHKGSKGAAGLDLYANESTWIPVSGTTHVHTGTSVAIPDGHVGLLFIRSSLGAKGVTLANSVGVIDSDYRGEIVAMLHNLSGGPFGIAEGERVAQLVIVPFANVELVRAKALDMTERGEGGFGSTGKA